MNFVVFICILIAQTSALRLQRSNDMENPNSERVRIYCFTFVAPRGLTNDEREEKEWGRIPHLHSQWSKCDGHGIYSNETNIEYDVRGLDAAILGMPISGPQLLAYTGNAATYLTIWGQILNTPEVRDGFDWYVMLDPDSYVQPDKVREILSTFKNGMWQVGVQQEWAINAAMLKEMKSQWSWLNERYTTGDNAGCPKWLLDDSGTQYHPSLVQQEEPWVHCAQDMMQPRMVRAMNEHLPSTNKVQEGGHPKWLANIGTMCRSLKPQWTFQNQDEAELCAMKALEEDCKKDTTTMSFCDVAVVHGTKDPKTLEGFEKIHHGV